MGTTECPFLCYGVVSECLLWETAYLPGDTVKASLTSTSPEQSDQLVWSSIRTFAHFYTYLCYRELTRDDRLDTVCSQLEVFNPAGWDHTQMSRCSLKCPEHGFCFVFKQKPHPDIALGQELQGSFEDVSSLEQVDVTEAKIVS